VITVHPNKVRKREKTTQIEKKQEIKREEEGEKIKMLWVLKVVRSHLHASQFIQLEAKQGANEVAESLVSTPEAEGETVATFQFL